MDNEVQGLSDEKLKDFRAALAAQPAEPPAEPQPAATSSGADAADPAGAAAPEKEPTAGVKPEGAPHEPEAPKGPVPYDRFAEVNRERNEALEWRRQNEQKLADIDRSARDLAVAKLVEIAKQHPELAEHIYGPGNVPPAAPISPDPKTPQPNPMERDLASLKQDAARMQQWQREQDRKAMLDDIESRATDQMGKHVVFKNPVFRGVGERLIAQGLMAQREMPVEKIVDDVAAQFRAIEESIKASYATTKTAVPRQVPPGAGSQGGAPPGAPKGKLSIEDGSVRRAFAASLASMTSQP